MLRIHFTDRDLARVEVAACLDPLWETVLAAHQLSPTARGGRQEYGTWRARARAELTARRLDGALRTLLVLAPARADYFPDFLTPTATSGGLAAGLDALRGTPRARLSAELARTFARYRAVSPWCRDMARGDTARLAELADGMAQLYRTVVQPGWSCAESLVETDRAIRARALRDGGVHGLLSSLGPAVRWNPPTLSVTYCESRDVWLAGRGLRLVPSRFCRRLPVALGDPAQPQVLVYPAAMGLTATSPGALAADDPEPRQRACVLGAVFGSTRARVLAALGTCATTGELAVRLAVSAATASGHVSALRHAGLVLSHRVDGCVVHTLTPLGDAMLRGRV